MLVPKFKRSSNTVSLSEHAQKNLAKIAKDFGFVGPSGKVHVSDLIEAVGLFQLQVFESPDSKIEEDGYNDGKADECYPPEDPIHHMYYMKGYYLGLAQKLSLEKKTKEKK